MTLVVGILLQVVEPLQPLDVGILYDVLAGVREVIHDRGFVPWPKDLARRLIPGLFGREFMTEPEYVPDLMAENIFQGLSVILFEGIQVHVHLFFELPRGKRMLQMCCCSHLRASLCI